MQVITFAITTSVSTLKRNDFERNSFSIIIKQHIKNLQDRTPRTPIETFKLTEANTVYQGTVYYIKLKTL